MAMGLGGGGLRLGFMVCPNLAFVGCIFTRAALHFFKHGWVCTRKCIVLKVD